MLLEFHRLTSPTWNPPPRYSVSEWAEKFRYLSREYAALPGRYSLTMVPYAKEPMDCANDPTVRLVALMWAAQTTKTTGLENVMGYFIVADPCPILMVQPNVEMAQSWSKERLNATVRDTPVLREVISDQRSRDSGNTIQLKTFPGGNLAIIGANAPAGLAGRPRRVVLLDEVDRFPASAGTEGDPVALAIRRTESFWNSVIYLTSTPTTKGSSRIENEYEQTDKRKWFVPCPKCDVKQTLVWGQVQWDEGKPETARYVCISCNHHWTDADRVKAIRSGEWQPTAPFNGKRGYFLNGIYSPFKAKRGFKSRLHQMATDFLEAKQGGIEQFKAWTNTFLAETWEEASDKLDAGSLSGRSEDYGPDRIPPEAIVLVAGVDVQKNRLEVEIVGVGLGDETWGIEAMGEAAKNSIYGDTEQDEVWAELAELLKSKYTREDGVELTIYATAIDTRHKPKKVREFVRLCGIPRVYAVYGANSEAPLLVTKRYDKRTGTVAYAVNTKQAKDTLFARLRIEEPGPGYCHFPKGNGYGEEYFQQLTAEVLKTKLIHGFAKPFYEKIRERNEALDRRVYTLAALDIRRPNLSAIAKRLRPDAPAPEAPKEYILTTPQLATAPKPKPIKLPRMGGGFVKGWMK